MAAAAERRASRAGVCRTSSARVWRVATRLATSAPRPRVRGRRAGLETCGGGRCGRLRARGWLGSAAAAAAFSGPGAGVASAAAPSLSSWREERSETSTAFKAEKGSRARPGERHPRAPSVRPSVRRGLAPFGAGRAGAAGAAGSAPGGGGGGGRRAAGGAGPGGREGGA